MVLPAVPIKLCIFILTWNVATHSPEHEIPYHKLLNLNESTHCPKNKLPEIYVIGLQDVGNPITQMLKSFPYRRSWLDFVVIILEDYNYKLVDEKRAYGLHLFVFVQKPYRHMLKELETQKTWIGGFSRTIGATSIRLNLGGKGITFVNSQLAAKDASLNERILDYHHIMNNHVYSHKHQRYIFDHDVVFWFGNLNFRPNAEESSCAIRASVDAKQYEKLLMDDQLSEVRRKGLAFHLMQEQTPNFPPTYKYVIDSMDFNMKERPAWCDRITYYVRAVPDIRVQTLSYKSLHWITKSDHKPVNAQFLLQIGNFERHTIKAVSVAYRASMGEVNSSADEEAEAPIQEPLIPSSAANESSPKTIGVAFDEPKEEKLLPHASSYGASSEDSREEDDDNEEDSCCSESCCRKPKKNENE